MRASVEDIPISSDAAFAVRRFVQRGWPFVWHLHPEHELTLILRGAGRRYVGDSIEDFSPGDFVLLASNVPHTWQADQKPQPWCESLVVQFRDDAFGAGFFDLPEWNAVRAMLGRAQRGLRFPAAPELKQRFESLADQDPTERLLTLLALLRSLTQTSAAALASEPTAARLRPDDRARIDAVCAYVQTHYSRPIALAEVAEIAHLSRTSFCRFFQRIMGRTFMAYLHELRVSHAGRLLVDTDLPITEICFRVGFGNLANFNRVYKKLRGVTPSATRRQTSEA